MQIDPKAKVNLSPVAQTPTPQVETFPAEASKGAPETTAWVPTVTLIGLISNLQRLPDTRADVIRQVRDRLAKGDLLTPSATAETAAAILGTETAAN